MLKTLIALILAIPAVVYAADPPNVTNKTITVTGSIYRFCEVTPDGTTTLSLGDHRASKWEGTNNYLNHSGQNQDLNFTIKNCDAGTKVKISAQGPNAGGDYRSWLTNSNAEAQGIYVFLAVMNQDGVVEGGFNYKALPLNSTEYIDYATVRNANDIIPMKIRGTFRRLDTSVAPTGTFNQRFTVYFTFE